MVQTTILYNITIPPAADAIKARYSISDGSEVIDYKNGTQIVLRVDDTIEKYSADRKTKQVFAFYGDRTEVIQFQKQRRKTIKTIFKEDEHGNFVPQTSEFM